jgi:hypothetical protein
MVFYAIFWTTYMPFALLILSALAERLTQHTERDVAARVKPVPVAVKPSARSHENAAQGGPLHSRR